MRILLQKKNPIFFQTSNFFSWTSEWEGNIYYIFHVNVRKCQIWHNKVLMYIYLSIPQFNCNKLHIWAIKAWCMKHDTPLLSHRDGTHRSFLSQRQRKTPWKDGQTITGGHIYIYILLSCMARSFIEGAQSHMWENYCLTLSLLSAIESADRNCLTNPLSII